MKLPQLTFKNVAIGVLIVAIIILSLKRCGNTPAEAAKEIKNESDTSFKADKEKIKNLESKNAKLEIANDIVIKKLEDATNARDKSLVALKQSNNKANYYAEQYEKEKTKYDTNQYNNSPYCDSLAIEAKSSQWVIGNLQTQVEEQDKIMLQKDSINNSLLQNINAQKDIALQCCNTQKGLVDKMYKQNRPRNSIWFGAEGAWSRTNPVSFVGVTGALQLKNGLQLELGTGLQSNNDFYIKAGVKRKISFRK